MKKDKKQEEREKTPKPFFDASLIASVLFSLSISISSLFFISEGRASKVNLVLLSLTVALLIKIIYRIIYISKKANERVDDICSRLDAGLEEANDLHERSRAYLIDEIQANWQNYRSTSKIFHEMRKEYLRKMNSTAESLSKGRIRIGGNILGWRGVLEYGEQAIRESKSAIIAIEAGGSPEKWEAKRTFLNYQESNYSAVERNVEFERIWIIASAEKDNYRKIWEKHTQKGIKTLYAFEEELLSLNQKVRDLAIVDNEIMFKSYLDLTNGNKRYNGGLISTNQDDLEEARAYYKSVIRCAKEYKTEDEEDSFST